MVMKIRVIIESKKQKQTKQIQFLTYNHSFKVQSYSGFEKNDLQPVVTLTTLAVSPWSLLIIRIK